MYVFSCQPNWEAMLTCIYEASASKRGHQNIKLLLEPIEQRTLFDEYIHVEADIDKAQKVIDLIQERISPYVYHQLAYCSMAYEEDLLDILYRMVLLGFNLGPHVLDMVQYQEVMRYQHIRTRLGKEVCRFQEFTRFHEVRKGVFVAHIEPKSRLVVALGPIFADRMPSEHFMIVDDVHREAIVHPKDESYYLKQLTQEELEMLLETERVNDSYTDLWKVFFESVAIKERQNESCQRNLFPIWTRRHVVEFL